MTISFMVLGAPRSATTWLANMLTTDSTLCLHDPLMEHTRSDLDKLMIPGCRLGIADTAAMMFPEWVNAHPCPKIILWRELDQINESLRQLGMPELNRQMYATQLAGITNNARVYQWNAVFQGPHLMEICKFLNVPFNAWRSQELKKMNIQPQVSRLPIGKQAVQELMQRLLQEVQP